MRPLAWAGIIMLFVPIQVLVILLRPMFPAIGLRWHEVLCKSKDLKANTHKACFCLWRPGFERFEFFRSHAVDFDQVKVRVIRLRWWCGAVNITYAKKCLRWRGLSNSFWSL